MPPSAENPKRYGFLHGFAFVILGHAFSLALAPTTGDFLLMAIGVFQLVYVIPIALIALVQGETALVQGALTAAGLTILLNGLYCASILGAFRHV